MSELSHYLSYQLYHASLLFKKMLEDGNSDDIHEFRVSLRRVRSLITLFLSPQIAFPKELKSALKSTNPLRELDVLIGTINPLKYPNTHKYAMRMRAEILSAIMSLDFYEHTLRLLRSFYQLCNEISSCPEDAAMIAITEMHFKKCLEDYASLSSQTPASDLHKLRVQFKIVRYGLEFLNTANIQEEHERIALCKSIQDKFGAIQDSKNQVSWLKKIYRLHHSQETKKLLQRRKKRLAALINTNRSA